MHKKISLLLTLLVFVLIPAHAVFDEKNLDQSLHVLHYELKDRYVNIAQQNKLQRDRTKNNMQMMTEARKKSNIIAMMLYSQKSEYIFGLTYACNMATDLYNNFVTEMKPLVVQERVNDNDVVRYDSLITVLQRINSAHLNPKAQKEKMECIYWANLIKAIQARRDAQTKSSITEYNKTKRFLYNLDIYARNRYMFIQDQLFNNGSETFFHILQNWDEREPYLKMVFEAYSAGDTVSSDWGYDMRKNLLVSFFIGLIAALCIGWIISFFFIRSKSKNAFISYFREWTEESRVCFIITCASLLFAIVLNILRIYINQNFLEMALELLGIYSWILAFILISSFFMKEGKDVKHTMYLYLAVLFACFLVIFLRINMFPNIVIAFTLPPLVLLCAVWECITLFNVRKQVGKIDRVLAAITAVLFVFLVITSWNGFILLTIQILTWWMMQLTCILVLTSIGAYMRDYGKSHDIHNQSMKKSWVYYFVCMVFCPVAALYSIMLSAFWGGEVFNLGDVILNIMSANLAATSNMTISLWTFVNIINLWFLARFIYFVAKQVIMKGYSTTRITFEQGQYMMYTKIVQILVYGLWFIIVMYMLHVSMAWIAAAWAGLLTGLGFASKTILENIFYGISLLSGQLKIGDLIKIGDVYGNVLNINYSSTVIRNDDGTVVTFTNSQLFEKNYRNLTRINEFNKELLYLNVGIKEDIAKIRKIIVEATATLPCLHLNEMRDGKPAYQVGVRTTGVNSFELSSCIIIETAYWVDPTTEKRDIGIVTECILNALRKNNIEIL